MVKQTIGFLRDLAFLGISLGCMSDFSTRDKQPVSNDLKYLEKLKERAQSIRILLKKKEDLFMKLSKCDTLKSNALLLYL